MPFNLYSKFAPCKTSAPAEVSDQSRILSRPPASLSEPSKSAPTERTGSPSKHRQKAGVAAMGTVNSTAQHPAAPIATTTATLNSAQPTIETLAAAERTLTAAVTGCNNASAECKAAATCESPDKQRLAASSYALNCARKRLADAKNRYIEAAYAYWNEAELRMREAEAAEMESGVGVWREAAEGGAVCQAVQPAQDVAVDGKEQGKREKRIGRITLGMLSKK